MEAQVHTLEATGEYRVLRRFDPNQLVLHAAGEAEKPFRGLIIDVETTGLNPHSDQLIEIALLPFTATKAGQLVSVAAPTRFLRDPGIPIPAEITSLTGITDAMVAGQVLDVPLIDALIAEADVVIAHNAGFDRVVLERYALTAKAARWGCSQRDVPWKAFGFGTQKLEWLLFAHTGLFNADAHRAGADCAAALTVLLKPFADGSLPLRHLLDAVRTDSTRFFATNSLFDTKDMLKARGYRWNDGADGTTRAWWIDVKAADAEVERDWLRDTIYQGKVGFRECVIDSKVRYSNRAQ